MTSPITVNAVANAAWIVGMFSVAHVTSDWNVGTIFVTRSPARLLNDSLRIEIWPGSVFPIASAEPPNSLFNSPRTSF
jgi:hypothetical protein